jgi:hypothetical protein
VRVRMGTIALGLALGLSLSACSDDEPESKSSADSSPDSSRSPSLADPSAPETPVGSLDCPAYEDIATRIVEAQSQLYAANPAVDPQESVDELVAELETLRQDAPKRVQDAVTSLSDGFQQAAELLSDPEGQNQTELLALATKLSEDSAKITEFIGEQCAAG